MARTLQNGMTIKIKAVCVSEKISISAFSNHIYKPPNKMGLLKTISFFKNRMGRGGRPLPPSPTVDSIFTQGMSLDLSDPSPKSYGPLSSIYPSRGLKIYLKILNRAVCTSFYVSLDAVWWKFVGLFRFFQILQMPLAGLWKLILEQESNSRFCLYISQNKISLPIISTREYYKSKVYKTRVHCNSSTILFYIS